MNHNLTSVHSPCYMDIVYVPIARVLSFNPIGPGAELPEFHDSVRFNIYYYLICLLFM